MCESRYQLYWWATEPYAEPTEDENSTFDQPGNSMHCQVDGLIWNALYQLFWVDLLLIFEIYVRLFYKK